MAVTLAFFVKMLHGVYLMEEQHGGACSTHHLFYLLTHIAFITMNGTRGAGGFLFSVRTTFQSLGRIRQNALHSSHSCFPEPCMVDNKWEIILANDFFFLQRSFALLLLSRKSSDFLSPCQI